MAAPNPGPRFRHWGDLLIHRSTGAFGDFQMQVLTNIIASEAARDGWLYQMTDDDVKRILARYKAHVSFWNANIDVIRNELRALANALDTHHSFEELAMVFDSLPPKRIEPEILLSYAQIRKDELFRPQPTFPAPYQPPYQQPPPQPPARWQLSKFELDELDQLRGLLAQFDYKVHVRALSLGFCEARGDFTRAELGSALQSLVQNRSYLGRQVQYMIVQAW